MPRKLLVATLGTSPAVITEAVDLLNEQGIQLDGVILFMTQDPEVLESYSLLAQHLPAHDKIPQVEPVFVSAYTDIRDPESAVEFMQVACRILKAYRDNGDRLFVCIAGGRKAMSSLLTLAVQFYGAERLFHIWAPLWIEEGSEIKDLRNRSPDWIVEKLHPSLQKDDRPCIVDLPFIGLFPLIGDILSALKGQKLPSGDLKQMLTANGLLTEQGTPTPLGEQIAAILENVESLPPARQGECRIHIGQHHYRDKMEDFARRLSGYFPFITEIQSQKWRQGAPQVKSEPPNVLVVGTRLRTDFLFQFRLTTTATTQGQLEAARRAVERYLEKNK